jgi:hypothetical protein
MKHRLQARSAYAQVHYVLPVVPAADERTERSRPSTISFPGSGVPVGIIEERGCFLMVDVVYVSYNDIVYKTHTTGIHLISRATEGCTEGI